MDINLSKYKNNLMFLPLGGSGEIGLNCNLCHYNGKWIMIDCGVGFAKDVPGVTLSVPDLTFFKKHKKDFLGLFITHVHEDHVGAIPYLWEELELPIYATKFACAFLKEKLSEYEFSDKVKMHEVKDGDVVDLKPFKIEFIGLTHSTPEMQAILVKTEAGNVLFSGDWRFDDTPVIGPVSNKKRLKELGDKGEILATICESTNIFREEVSKSESDLLESFTKIISSKKGLVLITTFASNVGRVKTIMKAAKKSGRKVVLVGRSLFKIATVAKEVGLLPKDYEFISDEDIKRYPKKELVVISTGCQGEDNAGLDKIANGAHKNVKLSSEDTVIFSSKIIPGNERSVLTMYNLLAKNDVEVITEANGFVHVSGHYCRKDLEEFYNLVRPKIAVAVHGEELHLAEHKRFAEKLGISNVIKARNGELLRVDEKGNVTAIAQIDMKPLAIDGKRLVPFSSEIIKYRKKILNCGMVFVNIIMNNKYKLMAKPVIFMPGAYDLRKDIVMKEIFEEDITSAFNKIVKKIGETKKEKSGNSKNGKEISLLDERKVEIDQTIRKTINSIFNEDIGKKPVIEVNFTII